jgi:hypothetical protein
LATRSSRAGSHHTTQRERSTLHSEVFRDLAGVDVAYDQATTVSASRGSAAIDADSKIAAAAHHACILQA